MPWDPHGILPGPSKKKAEKKYRSSSNLVNDALDILEQARNNIIERDREYNGNGVSFEDYRINGLDSCVEEVVENIVRLWNSKSLDKAQDATAYTALMTSFIKNGIPMSRFSPIFRRLIPELWKSIKADDERRPVTDQPMERKWTPNE